MFRRNSVLTVSYKAAENLRQYQPEMAVCSPRAVSLSCFFIRGRQRLFPGRRGLYLTRSLPVGVTGRSPRRYNEHNPPRRASGNSDRKTPGQIEASATREKPLSSSDEEAAQAHGPRTASELIGGKRSIWRRRGTLSAILSQFRTAVLNLVFAIKERDTNSPTRHRYQQCDKAFRGPQELKEHQRVHSGEKPYSCQQCGKSFSQSRYLKRHERIHTGENPYHCDQCGKSFRQSSTYKQHKLIHTGEKPHHCDQCGKSFRRTSTYRRHQRIHTGEKPYHCDQCGKSFSMLSSYKEHQRIHTGEKPYHCDQCGKSFTVFATYRVHQRSHTGEKPYWCDQCGKSFSRSGTYRKHQRVHTGEKPYWCDKCKKNFTWCYQLKRHQCI
uniref:uncharacterized protein n=1 Tax=Centroberyx gerrardi TaxID=166262 RepID=UPI003AAAEB98